MICVIVLITSSTQKYQQLGFQPFYTVITSSLQFAIMT